MNWILKQLEIFNFFRKTQPTYFPGLIMPPESEIEQITKIEETVAMVAPVTWKELDINKVPDYPMYSQDGSGSCVAMSWSLIATILYKLRTDISIRFSPAWIYQQRSNKTTMGMIGTEASKIASKGLLPLELMYCMDMGENAINTVPTYPWYQKVAEAFAFEDKLVQLPICDLETVASVLQVTGKPVNVWYTFDYGEWNSEPTIISRYPQLRHSVVAIDYGMWNGKKCIVIQDSWGSNSTQYGGKRIITEDFHNKRNLFSAYPIRFKFDSTGKEVFDGSIISFQKCMRSIGLFPNNISYVENWGKITTKACLDYQKMNRIFETGILDKDTKALLLKEFK